MIKVQAFHVGQHRPAHYLHSTLSLRNWGRPTKVIPSRVTSVKVDLALEYTEEHKHLIDNLMVALIAIRDAAQEGESHGG